MPFWNPGRVLLLLVAALLPGLTAAAAPPHHNAADSYRRAFAQIDGVSQEQIGRLINWAHGDPSQPLTPELRATLAAVGGALNDFRRGATADRSEFGLDYSQGFDLLLPHVRPMRTLTQLAYADTVARMRDGDIPGALRNSEAMMRSAMHLTDDGMMLSNLVGSAMYGMTDQLFDRLLDEGALNAADAAQLLRAMDVLSDRDPFRIGETVTNEQSMVSDWLDAMFTDSDGLDDLLAEFVEMNPNPGEDPFIEQIGRADREAFDEMLGGYDRAMSAASDAFMMEDREAAAAMLDKLSDDLLAGEYGPLAATFMPSMSHLLRALFRAEDQVRARREMLEKLAQGALLPGDLINAAAEYLAAAARLESLDEELRREIDTPEAELSPQAAEEWESLRAALHLATTRRKCDFAPYRPHAPVLFASEALALRDLFLALASDARRGLRSGDETGLRTAADSVLTQLGMIAHLSHDDHLAMSLVAREAAMRLKELIAALAGETTGAEARAKAKAEAHTREALNENVPGDDTHLVTSAARLTCADTWTALRSAANRLPRSSPFGLSRAAAAMRAALARSVRHAGFIAASAAAEDGSVKAAAPPPAEHMSPVDRPVTEQLTLFALLDLHWRRQRLAESFAADATHIVERMVPIFTEPQFGRMRTLPMFEHEHQLLTHFASLPLGDPEIPVLAPLDVYLETARRDLRRLVLAVRAASQAYAPAEPDDRDEDDQEGDEEPPTDDRSPS